MCGITGIYAFNQIGTFYMINMGASMESLSKRGPDQLGSYVEDYVALGHRRLSILDVSYQGKQPMTDESENYVIVFNGEIFNFRELKQQLESKGHTFQSNTDTEVLLKLFIEKGESCLKELVGFFAFAIYNKSTNRLFIARDRFGIKPLLFSHDEDKFIFASEMKAILTYNIPREIDFVSLKQYLHLNYIPGPETILKNIYKLEPGHCIDINGKEVVKKRWYDLKYQPNNTLSYQQGCSTLHNLMEESVKMRLVADVPLGTFLSGGIDSAIVTALAAQHTEKLNTFTIGFKDEKFFDETSLASLTAKKYNTEHSVFSLTNQELFENFEEALNYIDEPFADSSALAYYILSKKTSKQVKVSLSGDGADEVFGGYNKHRAEFRLRNPDFTTEFVEFLSPVWNSIPQSRSSKLFNLARQLQKMASGKKLSAKDRYYAWAGFTNQKQLESLFTPDSKSKIATQEYTERVSRLTQFITESKGINDVLLADLNLVLPNDMLYKADMMSMANSLEVRVPFLDHRVVEFAFSLQSDWKVNKDTGKKIIRDTFKDLLPTEVLQGRKKGFEVPLLKWLKSSMSNTIENNLLSDAFIKEQGIFNPEEIKKLKSRLFSSNPGDIHARIWGLIVFQYWYKKYMVR